MCFCMSHCSSFDYLPLSSLGACSYISSAIIQKGASTEMQPLSEVLSLAETVFLCSQLLL